MGPPRRQPTKRTGPREGAEPQMAFVRTRWSRCTNASCFFFLFFVRVLTKTPGALLRADPRYITLPGARAGYVLKLCVKPSAKAGPPRVVSQNA